MLKSLTKKSEKIIEVNKAIEDLKAMENVLENPRAWSPEELKEACNNILFKVIQPVNPIENLSIQFIFRNFFFLMHQTGLYNPQRRLWQHIAQTERVRVKSYTKLNRKEKELGQVSDLIFEDSKGRYVLIRVEHPDSSLQNPGLANLISTSHSKCQGLFYISNKMPAEEVITKIRKKTNFSNEIDRYRSPINDACSFNYLVYKPAADSMDYLLVHPDLGKTEGTRSNIKASLLKAFDPGLQAL